MKNAPSNKLRLIIIASIVVLVVIGLILSIISLFSGQNPYGESIKIQNYNSKVRNLSKDYEHNISAALYDIVQSNSTEEIDGNKVTDAFIRDGSDTQDVVMENRRYQGNFIVDIESLRQSYFVNYAYSTQEGDPFTGGYPLRISCVDESDVIYEDFECKEATEDAEITGSDALVNFLPHTTLSYELKGDLTGDSLVVIANLRIPEIDLSGNIESRRNTVNMYKKEVTNWISSQGFNPEDYTIKYNYTNDGVRIIEDHDHRSETNLSQ